MEQRFPREFKFVTRKHAVSIDLVSDKNRGSQDSIQSLAQSRYSQIGSVIQQSRIQELFHPFRQTESANPITRNQDLIEVKSESLKPRLPPDDAAHNLGPVDQCLVKMEELEMNIIAMMRSSIDAVKASQDKKPKEF